MNTQKLAKIQLIETKIVEIRNTLQTWLTEIEKYNNTLETITKQINEIKNQIVKKQKYETLKLNKRK